MMIKKNYYIMSESARKRFKKWLVEHDLNYTKFADKIGVSKQYVRQVVMGECHITVKVRELFRKGGYEIL